ncbi:MAG TPA: hypothetical protein VD930_09090 [Gemmatimonadales bacterium]|nr:hypothetical protein [Gemmatimonadales bacterium]
MIPTDSGYEARVRESFSRQNHMATLGANIVFIAPGQVHLAFPFAEAGFLACGRVLRQGRTLTICQADVFATDAGERALIATMLSTIFVRPRSSGGTGPGR